MLKLPYKVLKAAIAFTNPKDLRGYCRGITLHAGNLITTNGAALCVLDVTQYCQDAEFPESVIIEPCGKLPKASTVGIDIKAKLIVCFDSVGKIIAEVPIKTDFAVVTAYQRIVSSFKAGRTSIGVLMQSQYLKLVVKAAEYLQVTNIDVCTSEVNKPTRVRLIGFGDIYIQPLYNVTR